MAQRLSVTESQKVKETRKEIHEVINEINDGKISSEKVELDAVNDILEELGQPKLNKLSHGNPEQQCKNFKKIERKIAIQDFLNVITFGIYQGRSGY